MPYFDGTGPMGNGPRSGRGRGPCGRGLNLAQNQGSLSSLEQSVQALGKKVEELEKKLNSQK